MARSGARCAQDYECFVAGRTRHMQEGAALQARGLLYKEIAPRFACLRLRKTQAINILAIADKMVENFEIF